MHDSSTVNFAGRGLSKFPAFPNDLRIKELNISNNKLQNIGFIPSSIRIFNISHNQFQQTACIHQYIPSVESIDGSYNKIQSIEDVAQCTKLSSLNVEHNRIENEVLSFSFPILKILNISANHVTCNCGAIIDACPLLECLLCGMNNMTIFSISNKSNLVKLDISYNQISTIEFSYVQPIQTLQAESNKLCSISFIQCLPHLISLNINRNKITELNENLTQNIALSKLFASQNKISLLNLRSSILESIDISSNHLSELNISQCTNLKQIDAAFNSIIEFPKMPNQISQLILKHNLIQDLPNLHILADVIDLSNNNICNNSKNLVLLLELKKLVPSIDISGNPLAQAVQKENLNSSQSYGKIYKVVRAKKPVENMSAVRAVTRREIPSYKENKSALKPKYGNTPGKSLLLNELEEIYKNRCKSNVRTQRSMKIEEESNDRTMRSIYNEFTPVKTIWSRWGNKKAIFDSKLKQ